MKPVEDQIEASKLDERSFLSICNSDESSTEAKETKQKLELHMVTNGELTTPDRKSVV